MEPSDWEHLSSGPDDDEITEDECEDVGGIFAPKDLPEVEDPMADYAEYLDSYGPLYDSLCDELLDIIHQAGGNIAMTDAYIALQKDSSWGRSGGNLAEIHVTVLGIILARNNYIDTEEAIKSETFVLTQNGIAYVRKRLEPPSPKSYQL